MFLRATQGPEAPHQKKGLTSFFLFQMTILALYYQKVGDVEGSDYINANHLNVSTYIFLSFFFFSYLNLLILKQ